MHEYTTFLVAGRDAPARISAAARPELRVGAPPDFGGSDAWWSPEHLVCAAVASCFDLTLRAIAARQQLAYRQLVCSVRGSVGKTPRGLAFTQIVLSVELEVAAADAARAHAIIADAERHCIVTKSLNVPVVLEAQVTQAAA